MMDRDSQHDDGGRPSGDRIRFAALAYLGAGGIAAALMLAILILSPSGEAIRGRLAEPIDRLAELTATPSQEAGVPLLPIANKSSDGEVALGPAVAPPPTAASAETPAVETALTETQAASAASVESGSNASVTLPQVEPSSEPLGSGFIPVQQESLGAPLGAEASPPAGPPGILETVTPAAGTEIAEAEPGVPASQAEAAPNIAPSPFVPPIIAQHGGPIASPSVGSAVPGALAPLTWAGFGFGATGTAPASAARAETAAVGANPSPAAPFVVPQPLAGVMPHIGGMAGGALASALASVQNQHAATAAVGVPAPSGAAMSRAPVAAAQNSITMTNPSVIAGAAAGAAGVSGNIGVIGQTSPLQTSTASLSTSQRGGSPVNASITTSVRHGTSTIASAGAGGRAAVVTGGTSTASGASVQSAAASPGRSSAAASSAVAAAITLPTGAASSSKRTAPTSVTAASVTTASSAHSAPSPNQASLTQLIRGSVGVLPSTVPTATSTHASLGSSGATGPDHAGRGSHPSK